MIVARHAHFFLSGAVRLVEIVVRLFAVARQRAGRPEVTVPVVEPATVGGLRHALALAVPELAPILPSLRIAVANEYADDDRALAPGDEVAVIPPVSGGAPDSSSPQP